MCDDVVVYSEAAIPATDRPARCVIWRRQYNLLQDHKLASDAQRVCVWSGVGTDWRADCLQWSHHWTSVSQTCESTM